MAPNLNRIFRIGQAKSQRIIESPEQSLELLRSHLEDIEDHVPTNAGKNSHEDNLHLFNLI